MELDLALSQTQCIVSVYHLSTRALRGPSVMPCAPRARLPGNFKFCPGECLVHQLSIPIRAGLAREYGLFSRDMRGIFGL